MFDNFGKVRLCEFLVTLTVLAQSMNSHYPRFNLTPEVLIKKLRYLMIFLNNYFHIIIIQTVVLLIMIFRKKGKFIDEKKIIFLQVCANGGVLLF